MAHQAELHADTRGGLTSAGSPNAYTLTTNETISAYAAGCTFTFVANFANTGSATLNVDSVGAKTIKKEHDANLAAGDIEQYQVCVCAYQSDDDTFQLLTPVANQHIYFKAYQSSTQSIPDNTWTTVNLQTEVVDSHGMFAANKFTPTVAGYYFISGQAALNGSTNALYGASRLWDGSSNLAQFISIPGATSAAAHTLPVNAVLYFNGTTDYVEMQANHIQGSSKNLIATVDRTYLSGWKIS